MALILDNFNNSIEIDGAATETPTLGSTASALGLRSVAIGAGSGDNGTPYDDSTCIGHYANSAAAGCTSVGSNANSFSGDSVAIGHNARAAQQRTVAIGGGPTTAEAANVESSRGIAIGFDTLVDATSGGGVAVGDRSQCVTGGDIAIGVLATAQHAGAIVLSQGLASSRPFEFIFGSGAAVASQGFVTQYTETNDATQTQLDSGGLGSYHFDVTLNTSVVFSILVVGHRDDVPGESAAYKFEGCVANHAGTTAIIGTVLKTVLAETTAAWDVVVEADDTTDQLLVKATGEAAKLIRWNALIQFAEAKTI